MRKEQAIELLGGTVSAVAEAIGISYQAVDKWPDVLPPRIADRVLAALARKHLPPELIETLEATDRPAADEPEPERAGPNLPKSGNGPSPGMEPINGSDEREKATA